MTEASLQSTRRWLPAEMVWTIAVKLDVESLLALEDSGVIIGTILRWPVLMETVLLSPHSAGSVLASFLERVDASRVTSLCVANCMMVSSVQLSQCLALLRNLAELDCVNCRISPGGLFEIIGTSLPNLTELRWSVHYQGSYNEFLRDVDLFRHASSCSLRHMYVESPGDYSAHLTVLSILSICGRLEHLHIHDMGGNERGAVFLFEYIAKNAPQMTRLTFTGEGLMIAKASRLHLYSDELRRRGSDFRIAAMLFKNFVCWGLPDAKCTCVYLEDFPNSKELQMPVDHVIMCLDGSSIAPAQRTRASEKPWWSSYRSLTVVLLPRLGLQRDVICYFASGNTMLLRNLFAAGKNLTELNLSLCHFGFNFGWSDLVASQSVYAVRVIALPQCALKTAASVVRFAALLPLLEELDVCTRSGCVGDNSPCSLCHRPFVAFNRHSMRKLRELTRIQRLTICDVSHWRCLNFLSQGGLTHLRLSWRARDTLCCTAQRIGVWLSANQHLRSLTLLCPDIGLTAMCTGLCSVDLPSLRTLCLIAEMPVLEEYVQQSFANVLTRLRFLNIFHAHYCDEQLGEVPVTWTRCSTISEAAEYELFLNGVLIFEAPCLRGLCRMTTFIGLAKPQG